MRIAEVVSNRLLGIDAVRKRNCVAMYTVRLVARDNL